MMIVVVIWGVIVTIFVVVIEFSHLKQFNKIRNRLFKLEKCKSHGKGTETKKAEEAKKP